MVIRWVVLLQGSRCSKLSRVVRSHVSTALKLITTFLSSFQGHIHLKFSNSGALILIIQKYIGDFCQSSQGNFKLAYLIHPATPLPDLNGLSIFWELKLAVRHVICYIGIGLRDRRYLDFSLAHRVRLSEYEHQVLIELRLHCPGSGPA